MKKEWTMVALSLGIVIARVIAVIWFWFFYFPAQKHLLSPELQSLVTLFVIGWLVNSSFSLGKD